MHMNHMVETLHMHTQSVQGHARHAQEPALSARRGGGFCSVGCDTPRSGTTCCPCTHCGFCVSLSALL